MTIDKEEDISEEQALEKEQADFSAGFDGETAEEEYVVDEEAMDDKPLGDDEPKEEEATAEEGEEKEPTVNWEARFNEEKDNSVKLEARLRNMEGRFGSMNAEIKRMSTESSRGYKHPGKEELSESIKTVEGIDTLKEKYPDWAQDVEEREALRMSQIGINDYMSKDDVTELIRQKSDGMLTQEEFDARLDRETEMLRVEFKHPGWIDTRESKEFKAWLEKQDDSAHALVKSTRSADAIKLLDQFKDSQSQETDNEDKQKANESRLEKAIPATSSSRNRRPTKPTEHDAFLAGFGKR